MINNRINILILMVKAPQVGSVKTRLARDIGSMRAWQFYQRTLNGVSRRLGPQPFWSMQLSVTPDQFAKRSRMWAQADRILAQNRGDLGDRMLRTLKTGSRGQPVVLIGGDIPGVRSHHVRRAFAALEHSDVVFGPAPDGGFWLVGWNGRRTLYRPFADARWSTEDALADCLKNLRHRRVALVDQLQDVDTADDLRSL